MAAIRARDEWDDIPDEELDETLLERLVGLTEALPDPVRNATSSAVSAAHSLLSNGFYYTRQTVWIVATTSLIMFLPYIIEKERSDLEKSQVAQQRQMLLGPSAAVQAANKPQ